MDNKRLSEEIRFEIGQLRRLAATVSEFTSSIKDEPSPWHAAAGAKYVADLWSGFENTMKRRYVHMELKMPTGPDSHNRLLEEFFAEPELGGKLTEEFRHRLKKYKNFRHRFVHGYGFDISWKQVEEPLRLLPETIESMSGLWLDWLKLVD